MSQADRLPATANGQADRVPNVSHGAVSRPDAPFAVERESAASVLDLARDLLIETRHMDISPRRMQWMYQENPDGPAVVWSLRERSTGKLAGFTAGLPRRMLVRGQPRTAWNCADFSVLPAYRTLGLAVRLRRAAREEVDAGAVDFLYAHPNERMQMIHERAGHTGVGTIVRYAFVLHAARFIREHVRPAALGAAAGWLAGTLADPWLHWRSPAWRQRPAAHIRIEPEPRFDDRFDRLFAERGGELPVVGVRDARYLQWRYGEHPLYRTQAVLAVRDGKLHGFALFTQHDRVAILKDIFPPDDPQLVRDLVVGLVRRLRRTGAETLSFWALEGNPALPALIELGFLRRPEISRMFAYAPAASPLSESLLDHRGWHITHGDRDI